MDAELTDPAELDDYIIKLTNDHGKEYLPAVLPKDLERGKLHHCFDNSFLQAIRHPKYRYVEGIAVVFDKDGTHVSVHAWLTDGTYAYDPTWVAYSRDGREVTIPAVYRGIELDMEAVTKYVIATRRQGVIPNRTLKPRLFKQVLKESGLM